MEGIPTEEKLFRELQELLTQGRVKGFQPPKSDLLSMEGERETHGCQAGVLRAEFIRVRRETQHLTDLIINPTEKDGLSCPAVLELKLHHLKSPFWFRG